MSLQKDLFGNIIGPKHKLTDEELGTWLMYFKHRPQTIMKRMIEIHADQLRKGIEEQKKNGAATADLEKYEKQLQDLEKEEWI